MDKTKFPLKDLLIVLGAVGFWLFCSLSFNFLSLGGTEPIRIFGLSLGFLPQGGAVLNILFGAVPALILGGLAFGVKLLKTTSDNFKTCIIWERTLLTLFVVFALVFIFPFSHFFAVTDQRADIQSRVIVDIQQAEGMFDRYEEYANNRLQMYENRLRSVAAAQRVNPRQFRDFGFVSGTNVDTQIANKVFILRAKLYPSNYDAMKQASTARLASARNRVANWSPIRIVSIVNSLESEITSWRDELVKFSSFRADSEDADYFYFPLTFDDVTGKITELGRPTLLSLLSAVGLYVLMLLSWLVAERHSKNRYTLFGKTKETTSKFSVDY